LTINGGGKLLGNVSAEMVIITENGSIKGDVACKMLKVGFEASIIGRVYVHLTATSGSKIVMKEESLSIIENGNNDLRGASRPSSDRAEPLREGSESNVKEGLSTLKVMTPTGKDKKVKEIKDIKNMRHMDIKSEKLLDTEENITNHSEEKFQDPCRLTATAQQMPSDSSKLQYKEVEKLSVLKDQVEGLIESERVRGREREKDKVQSTILEYHDRSGIKIEDEKVNKSENENEDGKEAAAKEENESEKEEEVVNKKEEETGNRKTEDIEKGRYDMEERRKEDKSVKEIKRTRIEKENIKSDRQRHEERDAKVIIEEKSMREVKMKADGKRDTVERDVVQVEREEQRVSAKAVVTDGRDEDASAHNVNNECVGAFTKEGEGKGEGGEGEVRVRTVGNISNRERSDEGVNREVEQKVRLGRLGISEKNADTAEKKVKMDSFRRIETEENALREKEVEGLELSAGEGGKDKKRHNMARMDSKTRGSEERTKEEMERSDNCVDNKEGVSSKHQIGKEDLKTGSAQKRSEKTRMQDKKERKKNSTSDVMKSDSLSREDRHQSTGVSAGAGAGDLHSVGASPLVRKGSVDVSSRSAPAQGQGGGGVGVEPADQRVPEESQPEKGMKKDIREERRRLSKFVSPATVEINAVDREIVGQEAMRGERELEREVVVVVEREREVEREGVADMRSDAGSMKANDMMNVRGEKDQERLTVEDEDGEDDSLEDKNQQQHVRSVKIKGGITSRPGSHIPAPVK
jgi:hypothetical protein